MDFLTQVDVGNRALQRCGAPRIQTFADDSKSASEVSFVYDKVRKAELQRNAWRFSIRRAVLRPLDVTSMRITPETWGPTPEYVVGSIVSWNSKIYICYDETSSGAQPDTSPQVWNEYFGPMVATPWDMAEAYNAGELVYYLNSDGSYGVYLSLTGANADDPLTIAAWDPTITYNDGVTVTYGAGPVQFNGTNVLFNGVQVVFLGQVYESQRDLNFDQQPGISSAFWAPVPPAQADVMQGQHWLKLAACTLAAVNLLYPIGAGPSSQDVTSNVFQLPNGYLKQAPQDPKAGATSWLGAPSGRAYDDWVFEGNYLVSSTPYPIIFRFVADIQDVTTMDAMFCEGLACRVATEVVETLTQSAEKLQTLEAAYTKFMGEARTVNAIEEGSDEPPEDDWIQCRW